MEAGCVRIHPRESSAAAPVTGLRSGPHRRHNMSEQSEFEMKKCVVAIDNGETIYISSQMAKEAASNYMENLRKEFVTPNVELKLVSPGEAELLRETTRDKKNEN